METASTDRLGAAVALLFVQGWRVSELFGLLWEDLDAGVSRVRRAAVYVAIAAKSGATHVPAEDQRQAAVVEGWVHVPSTSVGRGQHALLD